MARQNVEQFLADIASNKGGLADAYRQSAENAVKSYTGLSLDEQKLLVRGDEHEIKEYLKDAYGAALSVNLP
jgi:hypothetical protein